MDEHARFREEIAALASFLRGRHEAVFEAWEAAVRADPELAIASTLSLAHFRDLMTEVLEGFELRLRTASEAAEAEELRETTADHGLHRWQQGYALRELVREWGHLQSAMLAELEAYGVAHPGLPPAVMPFARRVWVRLCGLGIAESVAEYASLQQAEAAGRLSDLQAAVEHLRALDRRRAEGWHEAAHDLRSNVGVVTTVTSLLADPEAPEPARGKALGILRSSVAALHQLLDDLMSLARLEAGREHRRLAVFDAAAQLRELASTLEPFAVQRGLNLTVEGPERLPVEGDAAKVRRIVQNLVLNALRYTARGGVTLAWAETCESDAERWRIRIQDTGPGLEAAVGSPLGAKLREATAGALLEEEKAGTADVEPVPAAAARPPAPTAPGEGIGLSIVKRLCELLDAGLEIASTPDGTVVQVVLPRRYPAAG